MSMQGTISAAERSIRSVFVGNIPYEATEEQLKDIFQEVGPVISFRLVYDRESGKPKGYGFCEYKDQDTAMSAMRNLNGYELNGRALRVDNAASEKNKEELRNLQASMSGPPIESPYGAECDPDKAPEAISKAVASLPPEQMFELMKQMKSCIQNNPNEARNMLLLNPQLAYALLQAQVVMRIVEPQVAMGMLMRPNTDVQPLRPPVIAANDSGPPPPVQQQVQQQQQQVVPSPMPPPAVMSHPSGPPPMGNNYVEPPFRSRPPQIGLSDPRSGAPIDQIQRGGGGGGGTGGPIEPPRGPGAPSMMGGSGGQFPGDSRPPPGGSRDFEMRGDPRSGSGGGGGGGGDPRSDTRGGSGDPRSAGGGSGGGSGGSSGGGAAGFDQMRMGPGGPGPARDPRDPRHMSHDAEMRPPNFDPRRPPDPRSGARGSGMPMDFDSRGMGAPPFSGGGGGFPDRGDFETRSPVYEQQSRDPRSQAMGQGPPPGGPRGPPLGPGQSGGPGGVVRPGVANIAPPGPQMGAGGGGPLATQDQEKAALIMQVLQLSDDQIAMLPPEQRQSIMVLKEQIARSTQNQ